MLNQFQFLFLSFRSLNLQRIPLLRILVLPQRVLILVGDLMAMLCKDGGLLLQSDGGLVGRFLTRNHRPHLHLHQLEVVH